MPLEDALRLVQTELQAGIALPKCQKCGCMESALKNLSAVLPTIGTDEAFALAESVSGSLKKMRPSQYSCLGCERCYPAVAQNAFAQAFPALGEAAADLSCEFRVHDEEWPPVTDRKVIDVEHYSYDNSLLRVIEGTNARAIYYLIIKNDWITEFSHASYLGKEWAKAELSLQHGFKYAQDGA